MTGFFEACRKAEVAVLRDLIAEDPTLIHARTPDRFRQTGLHVAAAHGHLDAVRLRLAHGADPHAREDGDHTYPLHWAAAHGHVETVRALLDAGADVHGIGDVHELDVIGWATVFRAPVDDPSPMDASRRALVALLVERGARHHMRMKAS